MDLSQLLFYLNFVLMLLTFIFLVRSSLQPIHLGLQEGTHSGGGRESLSFSLFLS
jgi:hypothetical protein